MEPRSISTACALFLAFSLAPAVCSQTPLQTPTFTTSADLVVVPTLVRGSSGDLLHTLNASDFLLTDNGVPQSVTVEESEHQPLSIVVLLQTGGSARRQFPDYVKLGSMLTYLTASSPHQIAMVTFDSRPEDQWDFTPHIADLKDGFANPGSGDREAAILDAVGYGIDLLRKQPPKYRRLIILISQTRDEGSQAKAEDVMKRLGENNITIESLTFSPEKVWLKDQFTRPRQDNPLYQFAPNIPPLQHTFDLGKPLGVAISALRRNTSSTIAVMSGGESLPFSTRSELEQQLALLANHFAATLTLSFRPTSKQPGFHSIQLHIAGRPDLQVSARTSYWASDNLRH